jgi:phage terminase small subunit
MKGELTNNTHGGFRKESGRKKKYETIEQKRAAIADYDRSQAIRTGQKLDTIEAIEFDSEKDKQKRLTRLIELRNEIAKKMSPQQVAFVKEYFTNFNKQASGLSVGYSKNYAMTGGMFRQPELKQYIEVTRKINEITTGITQEFVLAEFLKLAKISVADLYNKNGKLILPHELPPNVAAAISEIKEKSWLEGKGKKATKVTEITYKLHSKLVALDALGKHTGIYENDNKQKTPTATMKFVLPHNGRNSNIINDYGISLEAQ